MPIDLRLSRRQALIALTLLGVSVMLTGGPIGGSRADDPKEGFGAVYTLSNEEAGNHLVVFSRMPRGTLAPAGTVPTGGMGTGGGLHNQGALALSSEGDDLFAVNPGSNSISLFSLSGRRPRLKQVVPSGGQLPISVTVHEGLVYVLHSGGDPGVDGADSIVGFRLGRNGLKQLAPPIPLSAPSTGPAQIGFTPDGKVLIVTERNTNNISTYQVDDKGIAHGPMVQPSSGMTPFGFSFTPRGQLIVAEAFGGAAGVSKVSLYDVADDGTLTVRTASLPTLQTSACWVTTTPNGRFAYTSNTPVGTLTGLKVGGAAGTLTLLNPQDGVTAMTGPTGSGSAPTDGAVFDDRVLYILNSGLGQIIAFDIHQDGMLTPLALVWGFPASATGLVVR